MLGAALLAINLGVVNSDIWKFFWPALIILAGAWFLLRPVLGKQNLDIVMSSVPLEGAANADIDFHYGAGRLEVDSNAKMGDLITGSFAGGVTTDIHRNNGGAQLSLHTPSDLMFSGPWPMGQHGYEWKVGVTPEIPVKLNFHTGASESFLDLSGLKATDVVVETGASSTELTLPANAGFTNVNVKSGMASVKIRIPAGVGANIHVKSGLSGLDIDPMRFTHDGEYYRSADYASAANKLDLFIEMGVGSVEIR